MALLCSISAPILHPTKKEALTMLRKCLISSERKTGLKPATPSLEG